MVAEILAAIIMGGMTDHSRWHVGIYILSSAGGQWEQAKKETE